MLTPTAQPTASELLGFTLIDEEVSPLVSESDEWWHSLLDDDEEEQIEKEYAPVRPARKKKPSQEELYGPILTNEQQYCFEVERDVSRLSDEEEQVLWQRAKSGDHTVRNELVLSCLHRVKFIARALYIAYKWDVPHVGFLDLVQVGNEALLICFEKALTKENPSAYLLACAKYDVRDFLHRNGRTISTPSGEHPFEIVSLDTPISSKSGSRMLADLLPDQTFSPLLDLTEEAFAGLYRAISLLAPAQREVIERLFALNEHGQERSVEVSEGKSHSYAYALKQGALHKLHELLATSKGTCEVYSLEEASQLLGVTEDHFRKHLKLEHHIESVFPGYYRKSDVDALVQKRGLDKECSTSQQARTYLGIAKATFCELLQKHGVRPVSRDRYLKSDIERLAKERQNKQVSQAYTSQQACEVLGVPRSTFFVLVKRHNIRMVQRGHYSQLDVDQLAQQLNLAKVS